MNYIAAVLCFLSITIPASASDPDVCVDSSAETPSVTSLDEADLQSLSELFLDGKVFLEDSEIQFLIDKGYLPANYFESDSFIDFMSPESGINLPSIPFFNDLANNEPETSPNSVDESVAGDSSGNNIESVWGPALEKLRSSWLSMLILLVVVAALFVFVIYRRGLGVDNKKYK